MKQLILSLLISILIVGSAAAQDPAPSPTVTWRGPIIGGNTTPVPTVLPPLVTATSEAIIPAATSTPPSGVPGGFVVPTLDPTRMGIQLNVNLTEADWAESMRRVTENLSVKWIKLQIAWRDMQPNGPDDTRNEFFRRTEQFIEDAHRRGLDVLISIAKAPAWARSTQDQDGPPDDPQTLANFINFLLRELSAGDATAMVGERIDAIEIWNEPNLIREWTGRLPFNGAGYMQLFAPAYRAIRAYSPSLTIVTAGLAPTGDSGGSVNDRTFLQQMYAAGLGAYTDVVIGAHPYGWANPPDAVCCGSRGWDDAPQFFFLQTLQDYRAIMTNNGHANTPIWVTEFGWATWDGYPIEIPAGDDWMRYNDKWAQGIYAIQAFQIGQSMPGIGNMFLWNLDFARRETILNRDERAAYSIVIPGTGGTVNVDDPAFTERPLYWMIYDAVRPDVQLPRYD